MELEDAEVGKRYHVEWDDCCVEGEFDAVLKMKNYVPDSPAVPGGGPYFDSLTFDNGVTIGGYGVGIEEVPSSSPAEAAR